MVTVRWRHLNVHLLKARVFVRSFFLFSLFSSLRGCVNLFKKKSNQDVTEVQVFKLCTALLSIRDVHFHYFQAESCHFLNFSACKGNIPVQQKKNRKAFFLCAIPSINPFLLTSVGKQLLLALASGRRTCERPPSGIRTSLEGGDGAASIRTPCKKKAPLICKNVSFRIRLLLQRSLCESDKTKHRQKGRLYVV